MHKYIYESMYTYIQVCMQIHIPTLFFAVQLHILHKTLILQTAEVTLGTAVTTAQVRLFQACEPVPHPVQ